MTATLGHSQDSLVRTPSAIAAGYAPIIYDLGVAADRERMDRLLKEGVEVHDQIDVQLLDLARSIDPAAPRTAHELEPFVRAELEGRSRQEYGRWVYYPWHRRLVHLLPPDRYARLRGDRNRFLISPEQAARLRECRIGIVGMSAGFACATTMVLEGVGGRFRLADFDRMELSNLNRVRVGVDGIGINKSVLAARAMFEMDPYLELEVFEDGVHDGNVEAFLVGNGQLNVLIEECDDLYMKVYLRERARQLGIPVVMEMSFRGTVDIERFDLEPDRDVLHGLLGGVSARDLAGLSVEDKVPYVMSILGMNDVPVDFAASLLEIEQTVSTWPQLASWVAVGGGMATSAARRVLLDVQRSSGRFAFSGAAIELPEPVMPLVPAATEARLPRRHLPVPARRGGRALGRSELEYLISYAAMAPSGANAQPWDFVVTPTRIDCHLNEGRSASFINVDHLASYVAIGAAAENIVLAARSIGVVPRLSAFPDAGKPRLVCSVTFEEGRTAPERDELFEQIPRRVTNRKRGQAAALDPEVMRRLEDAARTGSLHFLLDHEELKELGRVLGEGDRLRMLNEVMHRELMNEIRWTTEEVERRRDGLDLAAFELSATDAVAMRLLTPGVASFLRKLGAGTNLKRAASKDMEAACAAAMLSYPGQGPESYLEGGRCLQRVWLEATRLGVAVHPSGMSYMFQLRRRKLGMSQDELATLHELELAWSRLLPVREDHASVLLLRLSYCGEPTARSLRLPLTEILHVDAGVRD